MGEKTENTYYGIETENRILFGSRNPLRFLASFFFPVFLQTSPPFYISSFLSFPFNTIMHLTSELFLSFLKYFTRMPTMHKFPITSHQIIRRPQPNSASLLLLYTILLFIVKFSHTSKFFYPSLNYFYQLI